MGSYLRSKLANHAFRKLGSKLVSKTPIHSNPSSSLCNPCKFSGFPSISSKFGYLNVLKQNKSSLLSGVSRRYYNADANKFNSFKFTGYRIRRWFQNPTVLMAGLVGCGIGIGYVISFYDTKWLQNPSIVHNIVFAGFGIVIFCYIGGREVVPYTKRKQFVILSKWFNRRMEAEFKDVKKGSKGKLLPDVHPDCVRVRMIAKNIIDALQQGLRNEQVWIGSNYASFGDLMKEKPNDETLKALGGGSKQKLARDRQMASRRQFLEGLNWEVLVIDNPNINASSYSVGKILIYNGLLKKFRTDLEIATIIAHEVGHVVARHRDEKISKDLWSVLIQSSLTVHFVSDDFNFNAISSIKLALTWGLFLVLFNAMYIPLIRRPFARRNEFEADYIGLMLMASAGYDPRVAPYVYNKLLRKTNYDSVVANILATHPSPEKRTVMRDRAMEEALSLYRQTSHAVLPTEKNRKRKKKTSSYISLVYAK